MALTLDFVTMKDASGASKKMAMMHDTVADTWYQILGDPDNILNVQAAIATGPIAAWTPTLYSTDLNALANAATVQSAGTIDNTGSDTVMSYPLIDFRFANANAFGVAPALGFGLDVYLLPYLDATTPPTPPASPTPPPANTLVGTFPMLNQTAAQKVDLYNVPLGRYIYKVLIKNSTGQALPATGNTIGYVRHH